jgi:hypothetical protein
MTDTTRNVAAQIAVLTTAMEAICMALPAGISKQAAESFEVELGKLTEDEDAPAAAVLGLRLSRALTR